MRYTDNVEVCSSNLRGTTCKQVYSSLKPECSFSCIVYGGLAQLARAPALHAGGQRFESVILHKTLTRLEEIKILQ